MLGRIVEIAQDQRYLYVERGFMVVQATAGEREVLGRVPLDDILALIVHGHGCIYSNNLLVALAQRNAPFVLCNAQHLPVGMLLPTDANGLQAQRIAAQIKASLPLQKRLWASLVKAKIAQQAATLAATGGNAQPLLAMLPKVKSGDPANMEAQAARYYWQRLLGTGFRRDQNAGGINALLNYGYTIARSAVARATLAAGLHPSLGLHHSNAGNPMRLVDDLIEPFRPLVDYVVWQILQTHQAALEPNIELTPERKRLLALWLTADMPSPQGRSPVSVAMQGLATSLAQIYVGEKTELDLPPSLAGPDLQGLIAASPPHAQGRA